MTHHELTRKEPVAGRISPALQGQEQKKILKTNRQTLSAWEEYLRALNIFNIETGGSFLAIEAHCVKAFELDNTFAESYFLYIKALRCFRYHPDGYGLMPTIIEKISKAAKHVYALDPDRPEALKSLSLLHALKGDNEEAVGLSQRALAMNPYDADAAQLLGGLYMLLAEWEKSIKYYLMAIEIDPIMKKQWGVALGFSYVANGQLEEASKIVLYQLELSAADSRPLGWSAFIYGLLGNKEKASDYLQKYLQLRPEIATADDYAKIMPDFLKNQVLKGMRVAGLE